MPENKTERLERLLNEFSDGTAAGNSKKVEVKSKRISKVIASMAGYKPPSGPIDPPVDPPIDPPGNGYVPIVRDPVLMNSPQYDRYSIGLTAFVPWATYRIMEGDYAIAEAAIDSICHRTRKTGAKNLEGFLMNGSLAASERYSHLGIP